MLTQEAASPPQPGGAHLHGCNESERESSTSAGMTAFLGPASSGDRLNNTRHSERRPQPESRNLSLDRAMAQRIGAISCLRQDDESLHFIDEVINRSRCLDVICWSASRGCCGPPRRP